METILWIVFFSFFAVIYFFIVGSYNLEYERKIERYRRAASDYTKVRSYQHRNGKIIESYYRRKPGRRKHKPLK